LTTPQREHFDAVVVGAGFAGMYMLHRLRQQGLKVVVLEAGDDVGGTWYWNRYPGARCDVESLEYSFSFDEDLQQAWRWSERYAGQPEILRYINHVADRLDLRRDIRMNTRATDAEFDPQANRWTVLTQGGQSLQARFCIMATGCLSNAQVPQIPGLADFKGRWFHTGFWPKEGVDFAGKRVGIVGTGSTGIQAIPLVAKQAAHLSVFQRTANYSIPLRNGPLTAQAEQAVKQRYAALREQARHSPSGVAGFNVPTRGVLQTDPQEVEQAFQSRWDFGGIGFTRSFNDVLLKTEANTIAREFVVKRMLAPVTDPALRAKLTPTYPIGTKRLCADTGYFETYNRSNVSLVDIKADPIDSITATGLRTQQAHHDLDILIFATGFDAITGALLSVNMRVKGGSDLKTAWADGPRAYLGLMTAGIANLFMITGPGSPSVLSNVVVSVEQHVEWIADCMAHMRAQGINRIEASAHAQQDWGRQVDALANASLLPHTASWYVGANIPGKPRVFMPYMGGVGVFRRTCDEIARQGYTGFELTTVPEAA